MFFPPDLVVSKTHVGNFSRGQAGATYSIVVSTLSMSGPGFRVPTSGVVTVVDPLPASLTATAIAGSGWSCVLASLTCTRSDPLSQGLSYPPILLTVDVAASAPDHVSNAVTVSGGGESSAETGNNTANDTAVVTAAPDLAIAKSHSGAFARGPAGGAYDIVVSNRGAGSTSSTVTVVDVLPAGLSVGMLAARGWSCALAIVTPTLTCTRSDALAPGTSYPAITLTVDVAATAPAIIVNTASVSGGNAPPSANWTSSDTTFIASTVAATAAVPALDESAMLLLAALLALAGAEAMRRR